MDSWLDEITENHRSWVAFQHETGRQSAAILHSTIRAELEEAVAGDCAAWNARPDVPEGAHVTFERSVSDKNAQDVLLKVTHSRAGELVIQWGTRHCWVVYEASHRRLKTADPGSRTYVLVWWKNGILICDEFDRSIVVGRTGREFSRAILRPVFERALQGAS